MLEVPSRGYQPIENYGVIGDLYTVALVGMDGSIDFLAFPHFDSPTVFAALLDSKKGGRFQIAPQLADARQKQLYLPDANILALPDLVWWYDTNLWGRQPMCRLVGLT